MQVAEHFISINGEGRRAGQLAYFVRFAGCNLSCEYCDTAWVNEPDVFCEEYGVEEIYQMIKESGICNITLTGGEPLLQENMAELLNMLGQDRDLKIEIETNGSVDISGFMLADNITFTLDYKTSVSGMEDKMCLSNYRRLRAVDTVKFVVGSREDLVRSMEIARRYHLEDLGCGIYLSPCFGRIEPVDMVDFLIEQKWNGVNIQLQMHKLIWNPDKRGV